MERVLFICGLRKYFHWLLRITIFLTRCSLICFPSHTFCLGWCNGLHIELSAVSIHGGLVPPTLKNSMGLLSIKEMMDWVSIWNAFLFLQSLLWFFFSSIPLLVWFSFVGRMLVQGYNFWGGNSWRGGFPPSSLHLGHRDNGTWCRSRPRRALQRESPGYVTHWRSS